MPKIVNFCTQIRLVTRPHMAWTNRHYIPGYIWHLVQNIRSNVPKIVILRIRYVQLICDYAARAVQKLALILISY